MSTVHVTKQDEMIDAIVHRHYGFVDGVLEVVMEANPHLWDQPDKLPPLLEITLPEYTAPDNSRLTRLWDVV